MRKLVCHFVVHSCVSLRAPIIQRFLLWPDHCLTLHFGQDQHRMLPPWKAGNVKHCFISGRKSADVWMSRGYSLCLMDDDDSKANAFIHFTFLHWHQFNSPYNQLNIKYYSSNLVSNLRDSVWGISVRRRRVKPRKLVYYRIVFTAHLGIYSSIRSHHNSTSERTFRILVNWPLRPNKNSNCIRSSMIAGSKMVRYGVMSIWVQENLVIYHQTKLIGNIFTQLQPYLRLNIVEYCCWGLW